MEANQQSMDPQLRLATKIMEFLFRPSLTGFRMFHRGLSLSKGQNIKGLDSRTVMIKRSNGAGEIRTRVYKPEQISKPLPIVLHIHGGGFAMGLPETDHGTFKRLMKTRECIVVAPDFRNSLEEPYPAGLNDCYDTLLWIKDSTEELGGCSDQIFVMGESGGGGLTAALSLLARDKGEVNIAFQMPLYPMIDDRQNLPSATNESLPMWTTKHNKLGWELYLRDLTEKGEDIPAYAAPARATDYTNLPPTATFIGELDVFLDETIAYVENLKAAGVPVRFETFPRAVHGFELLVGNADISKKATSFMLESYAHAVDNYTATQPL